MQEKFTRQAVNALKLARSTVQSCKHTYIGTEHILVGLLKEKEGTAGRILEEFGVEQERLQELIGNLIAPSEVLTMERVPEYSPRLRGFLTMPEKRLRCGGRIRQALNIYFLPC